MLVAKMGELWWKRPGWLRDSDNWPSGIKTKAIAKTEKEDKKHQEYDDQHNPEE